MQFEVQASYFDGSHDVQYATTETEALRVAADMSPGARYVEVTGANNRRVYFAKWAYADSVRP